MAISVLLYESPHQELILETVGVKAALCEELGHCHGNAFLVDVCVGLLGTISHQVDFLVGTPAWDSVLLTLLLPLDFHPHVLILQVVQLALREGDKVSGSGDLPAAAQLHYDTDEQLTLPLTAKLTKLGTMLQDSTNLKKKRKKKNSTIKNNAVCNIIIASGLLKRLRLILETIIPSSMVIMSLDGGIVYHSVT